MLRIIALIGAVQALAILVTLIRAKIFAVTLGPEGVGIVGLVDQVVQLVTYISAFSLPFISVKFLSLAHSRGSEEFQRTYANFLHALLVLTVTGTAVAIGLLIWRPTLFGWSLADYTALLVPALLSVPLNALHGFFSNVLAAAQRARDSSLLTLGIATALTAAGCLGILSAGLLGLYWANLGACLFVAVIMVKYFRVRLGLPIRNSGQGIVSELRANPGIIGFAAITYLSACGLSIGYLVSRHAVLTHFGEAQAGVLHAVIAVSAAIGLVLNPANGLYLTPILNRGIGIEEKMEASLGFQRKLVIVLCAIAMPVVLFPGAILTMLFSPLFVEGSHVLFIFVAAQFLTQLAGVYQALMIGFDDLLMYGAITTASNLVLIVIAMTIIPQVGLAGVGIAFFIAAASMTLLTLSRLIRKSRLRLPYQMTYSMFYGLIALLGAGSLFRESVSWDIGVVIVKILIYGLFLGSLLLFLCPSERRQLVHIVHRRDWLNLRRLSIRALGR